MKKIFFLIAFISMFYGHAQENKHVILISIDGLRPEFYMQKDWNTPNLKRLMSEGVYANGINSVFPSVTYPSHTTLITGAFPKEHGIFFNVPRDSKNNHWNWEANRIKTETLWDATNKKGLVTGAVMWPVSVGAPITYNFPVRRADDSEKANQFTITEPLVSPENLVSEMQKEGVLTSKKPFDHNEVDNSIGSMACYILKKYKPSLLAVHFLGADHSEHIYGRDDKNVHEVVENIDAEIGRLIALIREENMLDKTTVIVTGDHGFVDVSQAFAPNILLKQMGLITENGWKAKFETAGGSAFLYLKDEKYLPQIKSMLANLPKEQKEVFRIINRKELDEIGADPDAALALALNKGFSASSTTSGAVLKKRNPGGTHGYFPDSKEIQTGFIIWGAQAGSHTEIMNMGIQDIAPIISKILDLDFESKDGVLHKEILKEN